MRGKTAGGVRLWGEIKREPPRPQQQVEGEGVYSSLESNVLSGVGWSFSWCLKGERQEDLEKLRSRERKRLAKFTIEEED